MVRSLNPNWSFYELAYGKLSWEEKKALLITNRIGLWDILACCEREGSNDSKIKNEVVNDLLSILNGYQAINKIIFNGVAAHAFYKKKYLDDFNGKTIKILNSTSSLNPNNTFQILNEWRNELMD